MCLRYVQEPGTIMWGIFSSVYIYVLISPLQHTNYLSSLHVAFDKLRKINVIMSMIFCSC